MITLGVSGNYKDDEYLEVTFKSIAILADEIIFYLENGANVSIYPDSEGGGPCIVQVCKRGETPLDNVYQLITDVPDYWAAFSLAERNTLIGDPDPTHPQWFKSIKWTHNLTYGEA